MLKFELYKHHNKNVWVRFGLKGLHREYCLCYYCDKFFPDMEKNCPIAKEVFSLCTLNNLVLPVWECPEFREKI